MSHMRDSAKSAEWVAKVVAANPMQKIMNLQTGAWDGNIRTCPVRLNFFHNSLHVPVRGTNDDGTQRDTATFEIQMLFPPCATDQVNSVLWPEVYALMRSSFPANINPQGEPFGLKSPIREQAEKQNYAGFTPGGLVVRATTQFKPPVVDSANNPIVDTSRAYPGVWALVSFNLFAYPKPGSKFKGNRGVSAGLQAVMIIADDTPLAGGAVDTKTQFAGVNIDAGFDPAKAFGSAPPPPPPPPSRSPPPAPFGQRRSSASLMGDEDIPF